MSINKFLQRGGCLLVEFLRGDSLFDTKRQRVKAEWETRCHIMWKMTSNMDWKGGGVVGARCTLCRVGMRQFDGE